MPTQVNWQHTWQALGISLANVPAQLYDEIIAKYDEAHRYYHTLQHLAECLEKFDELRHLAVNPAEIELALWFHDAVYEPTSHDNEQLSADWAQSSVLNVGLDKTVAERIYHLIMATQHHTKPEATDTKILIDVDLAILGATPERYSEYEQQIRQEYSHVPEITFRQKRAEILQRFLAQETIFNTPLFIERYEQQARLNMKHALEQLCLS
ncbi:metal-dependent hydrolase [Methyloglobulus sp.]|uniref:HD domain-containing protein n=1 Tax=Methyloglobulus sp. TaxID=2518622 RepID=UPI0032B80587